MLCLDERPPRSHGSSIQSGARNENGQLLGSYCHVLGTRVRRASLGCARPRVCPLIAACSINHVSHACTVIRASSRPSFVRLRDRDGCGRRASRMRPTRRGARCPSTYGTAVPVPVDSASGTSIPVCVACITVRVGEKCMYVYHHVAPGPPRTGTERGSGSEVVWSRTLLQVCRLYTETMYAFTFTAHRDRSVRVVVTYST